MNNATFKSCLSETVQVVAIEGDWAWVQAEAKTACSGCSAHKGCGHGAMAELLSPGKNRKFKIRNDFNAHLQEKIVIGWPGGSFVQTVARTYLVPSILCIVLACLGSLINEGASALGALLGMGLGLATLLPAQPKSSDIVFMHRLKEQNYE